MVSSLGYGEGTPETNEDYYSLLSSGDGNGGNKSQGEYVIGVGQQTFRCTAWGLKPNTIHKPFLLTKDVSSDCAPIANTTSNTLHHSSTTYSYGANLVSTSEGKLVFDFRFVPQNSPYPTRQVFHSNSYVAIIPVGNQSFKVSSTDGTSKAESFIESKAVASTSSSTSQGYNR